MKIIYLVLVFSISLTIFGNKNITSTNNKNELLKYNKSNKNLEYTIRNIFKLFKNNEINKINENYIDKNSGLYIIANFNSGIYYNYKKFNKIPENSHLFMKDFYFRIKQLKNTTSFKIENNTLNKCNTKKEYSNKVFYTKQRMKFFSQMDKIEGKDLKKLNNLSNTSIMVTSYNTENIEIYLNKINNNWMISAIFIKDNLSDKTCKKNKPYKIKYYKNKTVLDFEAFKLSVNIKDEVETKNETIILGLSDKIINNQIEINLIKKGKLKIYKRCVDTFSINDEGPHCELKTLNSSSKWKPIKIQNYKFTIDSCKAPTIKTTIKKIKNATSKECGKSFFNLIKDIKNIKELKKKYFWGKQRTIYIELKMEFTEKESGETSVKNIRFELPMGC